MVMLNQSSTTSSFQPINLYKQEKSFSLLGSWLNKRREIPKGYKTYYAEIVRCCGDRGYASLKNETLAERLGSCTRTIQNYHAVSQKYNLITIISSPHGRSSIFVINYHPWMEISEETATSLIPNLPASISALFNKTYTPGVQVFPTDTTQPIENKETSETVESLLENHVEEVRSMHAKEGSQPTINITDSNIAEGKEIQVINANTTTSVSKDSERQQTLSKYSLEICKRFTLAYAKAKLMTKDEIRDLRAFSLYCLRTGEKDAWIAAFIENDYTLTPINPLKDQQVEQPQEQLKVPQTPAKQPKQPKQKKNKSVETKEVKGKYSYQVYLDYVHNEVKQGKAIKSVEKLTNWLRRTGLQDKQVTDFVDQMRATYAGGTVPQPQTVNLNVNSTVDTTSNNTDDNKSHIVSTDQAPSSTQSTTSIPSSSIAEDLEVLRRSTAIESLAVTAWQTLTSTQKEQLLKQTESTLLETKPQTYSHMPKQALSIHILGLVKYKIGEMLYKANTNNLTTLLQAIGKQEFESLEDYEQADLQEAKIDGMGYFYSCSVATQQSLLEEICEEIYLELGIYGLAKRI